MGECFPHGYCSEIALSETACQVRRIRSFGTMFEKKHAQRLSIARVINNSSTLLSGRFSCWWMKNALNTWWKRLLFLPEYIPFLTMFFRPPSHDQLHRWAEDESVGMKRHEMQERSTFSSETQEVKVQLSSRSWRIEQNTSIEASPFHSFLQLQSTLQHRNADVQFSTLLVF